MSQSASFPRQQIAFNRAVDAGVPVAGVPAAGVPAAGVPAAGVPVAGGRGGGGGGGGGSGGVGHRHGRDCGGQLIRWGL